MAKKLSDGFASGTTKSFDGFNKEVEKRMTSSFEKSFEEFDYAADTGKGPHDAPDQYGKPHEDTAAEADPDFTGGPDRSEQSFDDRLDMVEHKIQSRVKPYKDQFPGSQLKKMGTVQSTEPGCGDNAAFDPHQTDPSRLQAQEGVFKVGNQFKVVFKGVSRGIYPSAAQAEATYEKYKQSRPMEKKMDKNPGPEAFHEEVEKRMKHLSEADGEIAKLEEQLKIVAESDPKDVNGKQKAMKQQIALLKEQNLK